MDYLDGIRTLYAINGFAAILLYVPQIRTAWRNKSSMHSVSLITFGGWSIGSAITVLYAWLLVKDPIFTAASLGGMVGTSTMFMIVAGKRLTYQSKRNHQSESGALKTWPHQQQLILEE